MPAQALAALFSLQPMPGGYPVSSPTLSSFSIQCFNPHLVSARTEVSEVLLSVRACWSLVADRRLFLLLCVVAVAWASGYWLLPRLRNSVPRSLIFLHNLFLAPSIVKPAVLYFLNRMGCNWRSDMTLALHGCHD
jgi:hypothetical protein